MTQVAGKDNPNDVTVTVSDDPSVQREQVIRMWNLHTQQHDLSGRVVMIARKLGKVIERMQRRERWEGGLTVLALDYVVTGCCQWIYSEALRQQVEDDRNEGETSNGNSAQSGGGRKRERKGR